MSCASLAGWVPFLVGAAIWGGMGIGFCLRWSIDSAERAAYRRAMRGVDRTERAADVPKGQNARHEDAG